MKNTIYLHHSKWIKNKKKEKIFKKAIVKMIHSVEKNNSSDELRLLIRKYKHQKIVE